MATKDSPGGGADLPRRCRKASSRRRRAAEGEAGYAPLRDHVALQLRFLGQIVVRFLVFGLGLLAVIVIATWLTEGAEAAARFLRGR